MKRSKSKIRGKWLSLLLCMIMMLSNVTSALVYAESDQGISEIEDTTGPVITVTVAAGGHGSGNFFCEPPSVTVSDPESNIVSVEVTTSAGTESSSHDASDVSVNLTGKTGKVTVSATNAAGLNAAVTLYIAHVMEGRDSVNIEATCTEAAKVVSFYICQNCGEAYNRVTQEVAGSTPLGHQFGDPVTEGNITKKICERCGDVEIVNADPDHTVHTFVRKETAVTCTTDGSRYDECSVCGIRENVEKLPATGHRMSAWAVETPADCANKTNGVQERHCLNGCGKKETWTYTYSHSWSKELKVIKEATCTVTGEAGYQCTVCGEWRSSTVKIPMLPHTWEDDGDCTTPKVCSVCKTVDVTYQPSHQLAYVHNDDGHWQECQNADCTYSTQLESHEFVTLGGKSCTNSQTCTICHWTKPGSGSHNLKWEISGGSHRASCQNEGCEYVSMWEKHAGTIDNDCTTPTYCNKCGYEYIAAKSHMPTGDWFWNSDGHYRHCKNCDQVIMVAHVLGEDDGDCTTPVECAHSACQYVMVPGEPSHDYTGPWLTNEAGHYRECQHPGCVRTSAAEAHTGGTATCVLPAVCSVCNSSYGKTDPAHHAGKTEIRGYKDPTEDEPGYTGDTYCLDCEEKIAEGTEIPVVEHEHVYGDEWKSDGISHWKECVECQARSNDYEEHGFGGWNADDSRHVRSCTVCSYVESAAHTPEEDDSDCTTALLCAECGYELTAAMEHNFERASYWGGENGHYQLCQNQGCTQKSEEEAHTGGTATCSSLALCEICSSQYGEYDPENHSGREEVIGYIEPTEDTPGYTGDVYCLGCGQVKAYGKEIPVEECEHDFVPDYDEFCHWEACSICGLRKEGSYTEHTYDADGNCECGASKSFGDHEHTWNEGVITTEPGCVTIGIKTFTCSVCGTQALQEIPALGHKWENGICTVCGELENGAARLIVTNLKAASAGDEKVKLTWSAVEGAEGYIVYTQKDGVVTMLGTTAETSFLDTEALWDQVNYYWVYPYITLESGERFAGNCEAYAYARGVRVLSAVTGLKAESLTEGIKVSWNAVDGADAYMIYRREGDGKFTYRYLVYGTEFLDTTASRREYSFYRIYPYYMKNDTRITGPSESYTYGRRKFDRVSDIKAKGVEGGVEISWEDIEGAGGYIIWGKRTGADSTFEYIGLTGKSSFVDTKASGDEWNFYWVYPFISNAKGERVLGGVSTKYAYAKAK